VIPVASDVAAYVLAAEKFFLLPYLGFIRNILGRIRTTNLEDGGSSKLQVLFFDSLARQEESRR
jgi:hypothetical protein